MFYSDYDYDYDYDYISSPCMSSWLSASLPYDHGKKSLGQRFYAGCVLYYCLYSISVALPPGIIMFIMPKIKDGISHPPPSIPQLTNSHHPPPSPPSRRQDS